jgi:hypothetical protein
MRALTVKLREETVLRLKKEARASGRTVTDLVRDRIEAPPDEGASVFALTADLAGKLAGSRRSATNHRRKFRRP